MDGDKDMNNLNNELAEVHMYLKDRLESVLHSDEQLDTTEMKKLAHAVLITGKIAYEYTITRNPSPKQDKAVFYNTIYDD